MEVTSLGSQTSALLAYASQRDDPSRMAGQTAASGRDPRNAAASSSAATPSVTVSPAGERVTLSTEYRAQAVQQAAAPQRPNETRPGVEARGLADARMDQPGRSAVGSALSVTRALEAYSSTSLL